MLENMIDISGKTACITDIQRFSVHDGPGIRTMVFFKGCPLRCKWCQNPETQNYYPEMMVNKELCIGCLKCAEICEKGAIVFENGDLLYDRRKCGKCGKCDEICGAGARKKIGRMETLEHVVEVISKDKVFYQNTKGGLTVSGGEPTVHAEFVAGLLEEAKKRGIHTAMETCGYCNEEGFLHAIKNCDLLLFDVKHTDPKVHEEYTGVSNEVILNNLRSAADLKKNIIIRIPLIPGVNSGDDNLKVTAEIAKECHAKEIHLLPFHQMGQEKWEGLDKEYFCEDMELPSEKLVAKAEGILKYSGLPVNVGGHGEYKWQ